MSSVAAEWQGTRTALVIGVGTYADQAGFKNLDAPVRDARAMRDLLEDPEIGGYVVTMLGDPEIGRLRRELEQFLASRRSDETALIYLSCHGLMTVRNKLYFAATDTEHTLPFATALEAVGLHEQLELCKARRKIVILDCCFSGAFADAKSMESADLVRHLSPTEARGTVVLAASRPSESAYAARNHSRFTEALLTGLRTGAADRDRDGYVSVLEAFEYIQDQLPEAGVEQTPQLSIGHGEGGMIPLTRSPLAPATVPQPIRPEVRADPGEATESPAPRTTTP